ncbi:type I-E CRISPR-associated protein Cse2/CasB [Methanogenium sp. S4BF]|uniref:type I-E CRISPR-associated protein Cse2/CasB n=1 Tax=Methanogenium sp. S4BF TaxID=1789226 RepID=UPI00241692A5|nr:type I-E CRISPR-associated protein Cse2/CasB [Methanogenium sp. S4BF]WFN33434.1 type I-E CRISPR-associated protein Cse2/CasB [Methanogenium sp. S4BF]
MSEKKNYLKFSKGSEEEQILRKWWSDLDRSRGDRAMLRRCRAPAEVVMVPAYHRLRLSLKDNWHVNDQQLAVVAGVVSHLDSDENSGTCAEQMARSKEKGGPSKVSGLRFRRLLKVNTPDEEYMALVRMVHLMGRTANLRDLAGSAYQWNEYTKKNWAISYYEKAPGTES